MLSNISIWQLLIVLLIVIAVFGTKKLRTMGSDLGSAVKGFRKAVGDADSEPAGKLADDGKDADFDTTPANDRSKTSQP